MRTYRAFDSHAAVVAVAMLLGSWPCLAGPASGAQSQGGTSGGSRGPARAHQPEPDVAALRGAAQEPDLPRLRPVLRGVLYRSGSPTEAGLQKMCRNGWKRVYSLYGERTTDHGPKNSAMIERGLDERRCEVEGKERVLEWRSAPSSRMRSLPHIFEDIVSTVRDPSQGPVLVHCWNGLHYAGLVSAMALRQFCGLNADDAEAYWRANANKNANYPGLVRHVREFRPLPGYSLTAAERRRVCPTLRNGLVASAEQERGPRRGGRLSIGKATARRAD